MYKACLDVVKETVLVISVGKSSTKRCIYKIGVSKGINS